MQLDTSYVYLPSRKINSADEKARLVDLFCKTACTMCSNIWMKSVFGIFVWLTIATPGSSAFANGASAKVGGLVVMTAASFTKRRGTIFVGLARTCLLPSLRTPWTGISRLRDPHGYPRKFCCCHCSPLVVFD
jgi:hypothetical protein